MSYTPGPWKVKKLDGEIYINPSRESGEYALLAKVHGARVSPGRSEDTAQANARLIASAPELLKILEGFLATLVADDLEEEAVARSHYNTHIGLWNAAINAHQAITGEEK